MEQEQTKGLYSLISKYRSALMGFAALCILVFHIYEPLFPEGSTLYSFELLFIQCGYFGVDLFLYLSGLGLVNAMEKSKSIPQFYLRRVRRLLLPYVLVLIIQSIFDKWSMKKVLLTLCGYNFYAKNAYTFLWFVPTIITFYLLFPLYYKLFSAVKNKTVLTFSLVALWTITLMALGSYIRNDLYIFMDSIPEFLIGIWIGYYGRQKDIKFNRYYVYAAFITYLVGMMIFLKMFQGAISFPFAHFRIIAPMLVATAMLIIVPVILDKLQNTKIKGKFFAWVGTFSLELYCVQELFVRIVNPYIEGKMPLVIRNILLLVVVVALGYLLGLMNQLCCQFFSKPRNLKKPSQPSTTSS